MLGLKTLCLSAPSLYLQVQGVISGVIFCVWLGLSFPKGSRGVLAVHKDWKQECSSVRFPDRGTFVGHARERESCLMFSGYQKRLSA